MGWGSSCEGMGQFRALLRKFVFIGFRGREPGMSQELCRDVPDFWGCAKSSCTKSSCSFLFPGLSLGALRSPEQSCWNLSPGEVFLCHRLCEKDSSPGPSQPQAVLSDAPSSAWLPASPGVCPPCRSSFVAPDEQLSILTWPPGRIPLRLPENHGSV